ncbi:nitroreductase family protein [Calidifontibacillus erzurumensis]|uniref:Nitroreductase family protein n=1 Tax=Calidifontibacillus erzurumensis TaxID=2741433 RepID=A0A8J8K7M4_9BACI|nr:nitroreductase family protein [Calidifontibacillus erzurumensis]NSL50916.1 nitroreductase family protein [Calidifontibacillus erzurumensis]
MDYQQFKEIILGRRSIRKYEEREVSNEDIFELIDCARYAPSDTNSQTWEFIVIKNKEKIKKIEEMTWEALHEKAKDAEERGFDRPAKMLVKSFGPYATAFSDAPVLVICLATPYESKFREKVFDPIQLVPDEIWREEGIKSSCLAVQNFMLAAHAKGLGTCPMTGPVLLAEKKLREYLQIENEKTINMVVALGYPKETPKKLSRKEVSEITKIIE